MQYGSAVKQFGPSNTDHPKFSPLVPWRITSTSSTVSCPTSPSQTSPEPRSMCMLHGLRRPHANISGTPPEVAHGLPLGMPYGLPVSTSMRKTLASFVVGSCPVERKLLA